jgi:arabinofuranosyltransferase
MDSARSSPSIEAVRSVATLALAALLLLIVGRAWMSDDAFITLRTIDNFVNGWGLRWNVAERVQAFTHPLWLFLLTPVYAATGHAYYSTLALSLLVAGAGLALLALKTSRSPEHGILALAILSVSRAFVDYSTSGLENPLTHLLLIAFATAAWRIAPSAAGVGWLTFIASLAALTRMDTAVLTGPALALAAWRARRHRPARAVAVGLLPLLAWESFSLVYYGFPFPNTAYAKLATAVPAGELAWQGLIYLRDSLRRDPITLTAIAVALACAALTATGRDDEARVRAGLAVGIALYLGYVVRIGGDFMSGRFLTPPFVLAVTILSRSRGLDRRGPWTAALSVVIAIGVVRLSQPVEPTSPYTEAEIQEAHGIVDERRHYLEATGLLTARRGAPLPQHEAVERAREFRESGRRVQAEGAVGIIGYAAGPGIHIVDLNGLGDPLLARLPSMLPWRPGHFTRRRPAGYQQTLETGRNRIQNPGLAAYYDRLALIVRGPVFGAARLLTVIGINVGAYDGLTQGFGYARVPLERVSHPFGPGCPWDSNLIVYERGVDVMLDRERRARRVELSLKEDNSYCVTFWRSGTLVARHTLDATEEESDRLAIRTIVLDEKAGAFDRLHVQMVGGFRVGGFGHVRLIE